MKKLAILFCAALAALGLAACAAKAAGTQAQTPEPAGSTAAAASDKSFTASNTESEQTMVIYFSATGTTAQAAATLAEALDCQSLEITPAKPYTAKDLDYNDASCRANAEMNDASARPEISSDLSAAENCRVIYLGYPIWWGTAPRIINTFLESYDLSGAAIYTFCTSGGSGIDRSVKDLQEAYPQYNILSGHRFSSGASAADAAEWLASLEPAAAQE